MAMKIPDVLGHTYIYILRVPERVRLPCAQAQTVRTRTAVILAVFRPRRFVVLKENRARIEPDREQTGKNALALAGKTFARGRGFSGRIWGEGG